MTDNDKHQVNSLIETRQGSLRMRFPADADTTARLKRLMVDTGSAIPWWRRLLQKLRGES